ncbi:MAG: ribosomal protein large subunit ribosomal protein [Candidatus Nomurabacteria bacterium]|nr:ribosomal protein large subunit ribosomal protein [Candidatus Nomurabacteria bacterium]
MNLLKRTTENKKAKTVGRGSKRGKTSGRGTKGQASRAGNKKRPELRDRIKKLPKLRGRGKNINKAFRIKATPVNVGMIAAAFEAKASINPSVLFEKGLIRRVGGKLPAVKVLAGGEITYAVSIFDCDISPAAKVKIEAAGGTVNG